jgi:predicted acylesterase/phospholipase RssA
MRREQLEKLGTVPPDEFLLDMDNEQFMVFLNERIAAKNEADRQAIEQEKAKLAREAEIKKAQEEAVAKERDRMELLRVQEENARVLKLAEEQNKADRAAKKLIDDAKAEAERIVSEQKVQAMIEAQRKIDEENARLAEEQKRVQDTAYQAWLAEIEYDTDFPHLWKFETVNGVVSAYRFKSAFKPER